ncbi:MAG TPA: ComEC/Rec2 family competence protein [Ilumatobacteraceae bacterium]|nr:ComEC/Rec2 family competence protein [Ilumatobacteraceae bacterium]
MNEVTTAPGYDDRVGATMHPADDGRPGVHVGGGVGVGDTTIIGLALVTSLAVWARTPLVAVGAVALLGVSFKAARQLGWRWFAVGVVVAAGAGMHSQQSWAELAPDQLGPFTGWGRLMSDPQPYPSSTRVIIELEGERFEMWSRGRAQQQRVMRWRGGQWIQVHGERVLLDSQRAHRVAWQHVVGRFDLDWASDVAPGGPVARASNRVRAAIERAAEFIPEPHGALFRGLVIGDDREQPPDMTARFRASGLSHLTAVSGQNVAFVLAGCGPLLVRLRPSVRWATTVVVIAWFVVITRFEPSILRAGVMAGLSATAFMTGRERSPVRILALAVTGLLLVDPLLLWSVGFWLSVGATAGVCTVGPWLAKRFGLLGPVALPLGITLGAQLGVVIPSLLVFGRLPVVSVVANLLAVPVAGMVMLYGLPAGLVVGAAPVLGPVVMFPARVGTKWVDTVAMLGARLEPDPPWSWIAWVVVLFVVLLVVLRARFHGR